MGSFHLQITMRALLALVIFITITSVAPDNSCQQKNEILKKTIIKLAQKPKDDCNICYDDIFAAATDCVLSFDWQNCIFDILGAGNPCAECVCDIIADIGSLFGQDWECYKSSNNK